MAGLRRAIRDRIAPIGVTRAAPDGAELPVILRAGDQPVLRDLPHLREDAGALKDLLGKGPKGVQAEIFNDTRFERLEAEGRAEFAVKIEEARKIILSQALGGGQSRSGVDGSR